MSGDGRRFLTVDEPDGWAVWITEDGPAADPGADHPVSAPLPAEQPRGSVLDWLSHAVD